MLSRRGGGSRFYSLGYICLESSKNFIGITEAVARSCSVEKVFLEISKNTFSYKSPSVATSGITYNLMVISIFFCKKFRKEFCKISKKTFSYRTPLGKQSSNMICFAKNVWNKVFSFRQNILYQMIQRVELFHYM